MRFCNAQIALMFKMIDKKKLNALKFWSLCQEIHQWLHFALVPTKTMLGIGQGISNLWLSQI